MKLLNPLEVKDNFNKKQAVDVVQAAYMKKVLGDLQTSINAETDKFNKNLSDQRNVYMQEKLSLQGEIKALEGILKDKREERASLMIPVDTLKQQAESLVKELEHRKESIIKQEEELEEKIELVKYKLDRAAEREQSLIEQEVALMSKRVGIDDESKQISDSHSRLNQMISDFNKEFTDKSKYITEQESILKIEQQRSKEYIEMREKEFIEKEKGLADRRSALDRAWEELKRKS